MPRDRRDGDDVDGSSACWGKVASDTTPRHAFVTLFDLTSLDRKSTDRRGATVSAGQITIGGGVWATHENSADSEIVSSPHFNGTITEL